MRDTILCLCDLTGVMARPWVEHGYQAVLVDPQHGCDHEDGAYLKDDVRFVGSRDERLGIPWSQAEKVLDIDYDDGYGSQEIAADLVVAFTDGGFLRREEYDGSEWWEYEPPFRVPETQKPFGRVKRTYPAYSLEDLNYPMEATEE